MLDVEFPVEKQGLDDMPSFNHSYICSQILRQLFAQDSIEALAELTLDIDKGITPDISIFPAKSITPNFSRDVTKVKQRPLLTIEIISASQNIQDILEKSERMVQQDIKAVWAVEPFTRAIFVTTLEGEQLFYNQEIESEGVKVDFKKIFAA